MTMIRLPALSLIEALRGQRESILPWRMGCTTRADGILYLAAPLSNRTLLSREPSSRSEQQHIQVTFDPVEQRFSAKVPDGSEAEVELRPDWSDGAIVSSALQGWEELVPPTRIRMTGALGLEGWLLTGSLKVGVIGAGGLGSQLLVQMVADGYRDFVICDPDVYDLSNLGRMPPGFGEEIVGLPKAEALSQKLKEIEPLVRVVPIQAEFEGWDAFSNFIDCDIVVCCCDSARTRRAAARFGCRYLVPLIHIGTGIFAGSDTPVMVWEGAVWNPGDGTCLSCLLNLDRSAAERSDLEREVAERRLGSLRSLNLAPISWAMRSIEDLFTARLLESTYVQGAWIEGHAQLVRGSAQRIPDCACSLLAAGDYGL
ncbi:MAG: ThiF family adenylyltransferase [Fimbriimonadaceae bacterium]|nr:ThiF family adenylyltransferase [Fimbriimonadaceae bacterium]